MNWTESLILGILQGITEFLPISSSGHLVLAEKFLGLNMENLKGFDVMIHIGTLFAVLIYFWRDVFEMIKAVFRFLKGKLQKNDPWGRLIIFIIIGTIPAVFIGYFCEEWLDLTFRNITAVAMLMILTGFVFILGESFYKRGQKSKELNWLKALIIGCAQAAALLPGVSRSGSTIAAGLFQGIGREAAARFSFLLGIPAIIGAGGLTAIKISENGGLELSFFTLSVGFLSSLILGLLSIHILMKFLKNHSLRIFAVYLILAGAGIILYLI